MRDIGGLDRNGQMDNMYRFSFLCVAIYICRRYRRIDLSILSNLPNGMLVYLFRYRFTLTVVVCSVHQTVVLHVFRYRCYFSVLLALLSARSTERRMPETASMRCTL